MKLEKWALIAEIIGGAAIVVTLVVLVVEIRANTDAIAVSNRQSMAMRAQELALTLVEDRALNDAVNDAIEGRGVPDEMLNSVETFGTAVVRVAEEAYFLNQEGKLDEAFWEQRANVAISLYRDERLRRNFIEYQQRGFYVDEFADWLERELVARYGE
jgi:hypothetical protein